MLIAQAFEDPLGRMPLIARSPPIFRQPLIDDSGEPIQIGPPVAGRDRNRQNVVLSAHRLPLVCRWIECSMFAGQVEGPKAFRLEPEIPWESRIRQRPTRSDYSTQSTKRARRQTGPSFLQPRPPIP